MSAPIDFIRMQKNLEIDPTSRLVLYSISFYTHFETGECYPSISTLARETGLHSTTVRRHVHELEKIGVIKLKARENATSIITLVGYKEWVNNAPQVKAKGTSVALEATSVEPVDTHLYSARGVLAQNSSPTSAALAEIYNLNILNNSFNKKNAEDITNCGFEEETRVRIENEKIKLCDQLNQFWLKEFNGQQDDLNLSLLQVAAYVQPNNVHSLEKQVSSQLARIARERRERDKRYQNSKNPTAAREISKDGPKWVGIQRGTQDFQNWVGYARSKSENQIAEIFQKSGYALVPNADPAIGWEEFLVKWRALNDERRTKQTAN